MQKDWRHMHWERAEFFDGRMLYRFQSEFSDVDKNNRWTVLHQDGQLDLQTGNQDFSTIITRLQPI